MKKGNESGLIVTYIRRFLTEYVPTHKSGSVNTQEGYKNTIRLYLYFLEGEKGIKPETLTGECFSKALLEEWIIWLRSTRNCSLCTCRNRLSLFRTFLRYLYDKDPAFGCLYVNSKEVKIDKHPKVKVEGLSREAVRTILSLPDLSTRAGRRDMVLMETMYVTAARIDEVLSMKISNLHLDAKKPHIIIRGKGGKTRTLYVQAHTVTLMKKYVKAYHGENPNPDSIIFYSIVGGLNKQITQTAIDKRLKMYASKGHALCEDIPLGLHSHQFRHARASHWLEDGINIVQISFLLGHENLETTMKYLDVTIDDVKAAMATLENEKDKEKNTAKKWKEGGRATLASLCGL